LRWQGKRDLFIGKEPAIQVYIRRSNGTPSDGAVIGDIFRGDIEQILAPTLSPGDIVVMDNLPCHKVAGLREAIENRQAQLLYLPPYSPDLNPIEQAFAKLKALLRKAGERTRDGLWNAIAHILKLYSPAECRNLFRHSGYPT
jgi:transposase